MRAAVVSALLVSGMTGLFVACVGDDPATAVPRVSPDGSTNASGGASSSGQASSSGGSSGEGPSDGSTDAATLACGYPGEPCCVAPTRLCRAGTVCSTSSTTCVVSDMVAVGRFGLLGKRPISSRWDGSTWMKPVVVDKSNWEKVLIDGGYYKRSQFD